MTRIAFFWSYAARVRSACLLPLALMLVSMGATNPTQAAASDWSVHRSRVLVLDRRARALMAHPERGDVAVGVVLDTRGSEVATLLHRFELDAQSRPHDYGIQLALAQLLLASRHWAEAASRFAIAETIRPEELAARWGRGQALVAGGDNRAAVVELRAALALALPRAQMSASPSSGASPSGRADASRSGQTLRGARLLVTAAEAVGDVDAEVDGRRAWARLQPGRRTLLELAATLGKAGRPREAADLLAERAGDPLARGSPEQTARWKLTEGQLRAAAGDLEGATAALQAARQVAPRGPTQLRRDLWAVFTEVARRRGALDTLKAELARPSDVVEWAARARIADEQGDLRGAWAALDEAIRRSPRDLDLLRRRIAVARRVGTGSEVARLYEELATLMGRELPAVATEALDGLWRLGRQEAAVRAFDDLMVGREKPVPMLRAMAEVAARWGDDRRSEVCWEILLKRDPRSEVAILAVGEIRLQRGQRRLAVATWRALLSGRGRSLADAHARLGEILADHELREEALAEAKAAVSSFPEEPRYHRLMATILERQSPGDDAEREWEAVLRHAQGRGAAAPMRVEARTRLVALWMRAGNARVDVKLGELETSVSSHPGDRDAMTLLVEAELRTGRIPAAISLLKAALSRPDDPSEEDADVILLLVRTLRQAGQADEAMAWLEQLSQRFPGRAREAWVQLADIALDQHADRRAQEYAERAAAADPGNARVIIRVAAVEERLGHLDQAVAIYRRIAGSGHPDASATLAQAALLARLGEVDEQRSLLRDVLRGDADEETITVAGARAIALEEAGGTLGQLESLVADTPDLNALSAEASARRRVLCAILWRLVPPVYRARKAESSAPGKLEHFGRHGLRPLLELVDAPDAAPDLRAIEILGMLGRFEAVPALARILVPEVEPPRSRSGSGGWDRARDQLTSTTLIALGRIGGAEARLTLESFERLRSSQATSQPASRAPLPASWTTSRQESSVVPLLWALGRVGGSRAVALGKQEIARNTPGGSVVGCLALGRAGGVENEWLLQSVAEDPLRSGLVRAAALLGLGLGPPRSKGRAVLEPLLQHFVDTADPDLAVAGRTALAWIRRPTNDPPGGLPVSSASASAFTSGFAFEPGADEAVAIVGDRVDPEALVRVLEAPPSPAGLIPP